MKSEITDRPFVQLKSLIFYSMLLHVFFSTLLHEFLIFFDLVKRFGKIDNELFQNNILERSKKNLGKIQESSGKVPGKFKEYSENHQILSLTTHFTLGVTDKQKKLSHCIVSKYFHNIKSRLDHFQRICVAILLFQMLLKFVVTRHFWNYFVFSNLIS